MGSDSMDRMQLSKKVAQSLERSLKCVRFEQGGVTVRRGTEGKAGWIALKGMRKVQLEMPAQVEIWTTEEIGSMTAYMADRAEEARHWESRELSDFMREAGQYLGVGALCELLTATRSWWERGRSSELLRSAMEHLNDREKQLTVEVMLRGLSTAKGYFCCGLGGYSRDLAVISETRALMMKAGFVQLHNDFELLGLVGVNLFDVRGRSADEVTRETVDKIARQRRSVGEWRLGKAGKVDQVGSELSAEQIIHDEHWVSEGWKSLESAFRIELSAGQDERRTILEEALRTMQWGTLVMAEFGFPETKVVRHLGFGMRLLQYREGRWRLRVPVLLLHTDLTSCLGWLRRQMTAHYWGAKPNAQRVNHEILGSAALARDMVRSGSRLQEWDKAWEREALEPVNVDEDDRVLYMTAEELKRRPAMDLRGGLR